MVERGGLLSLRAGAPGPAYTLSFLSICRLSRFLGSIPHTARSTDLAAASLASTSPIGVT